ncbi:MBL fold metallo-hydrolase [Clostridium brassicae]|uniref:MBL fold metallo-hydrolase n=1 Tax=Clostridium brassicae TaxID=2999072 RepID=A0ABT4D5S5_9CLOT|nr:MBL fold metallo-hydrolase [Clostridium brassicae]MCY6957637.1 MBL fold metallo-hydrolase [Clostridium brassicae]
MKVQRLVLGMFNTNCYIISGKVLGKCILIDPADDAEVIRKCLVQQNLVPEAILLTHGHYDHFLAVPKLQEVWKELPVYCHSLDCPKEKEQYDMGMVFQTVTAFPNVRGIEEGQKLELAGFNITVYHTPGHTKGSVLFLVEDGLFTGDTLFCRSIGRTDFAGGDDAQMYLSLRRISEIKGDYNVYPGHEEVTTLSAEKRYNPYLK